jgi:DNA helicase-2/ATP-dependent DNA helicase PcrA
MMPSNEVIIASAGAGKTTAIVRRALAICPRRSAIVTFTNNNVSEIRAKFFDLNGFVPPEVSIYPWYSFILHEMARPYQGILHLPRIAGVELKNGSSAPYAKKADVARYFFNRSNEAYSDKLCEFALRCEQLTKGAVVRRLSDMFDHILIDEVQDLAGYDIEIVEALIQSPIVVTAVGDIRQSTFRTNYSRKNKGFVGREFLRKVEIWEKRELCKLTYMVQSYRCIQKVCDLADSIFPELPRAKSLNETATEHDGIFIVRTSDVSTYVERFGPQVLRLNKKFRCDFPVMNFGASKGLGFLRVLIVPYAGITKWLASGDSRHVEGSAAEVYVAITRARQSVAFVHDIECRISGAVVFDPKATSQMRNV